MISSETELDLLEQIAQSRTAVRQRDLARIVGLSLGMTNSILKRLAQKGLLQVRKVNNRNIQYVVSSQGVEEIARRSYRYLKRTIKNVVYYKEAIDRLLGDAAGQGFRRLVLVGKSDLDFIVEHFCDKHRLAYGHVPAPSGEDLQIGSETFLLYSENTRPPERQADNRASLRLLFTARPPAPVAAGEP